MQWLEHTHTHTHTHGETVQAHGHKPLRYGRLWAAPSLAMQVLRSFCVASRKAQRSCRAREPMQRHFFGVASVSIPNRSRWSLVRSDSSSQPALSRTHGMLFSTALPGESGEDVGVKNKNVFGVGGPGSKRPGVRRKNHMKRRRMRFAKTKKHHKVSQKQQKAAKEKRLERIREKQQFFKDIGMTKKEFLG